MHQPALVLQVDVGRWKDEKDLKSRAERLREKLGLEALLLTRGEEGMTLFAKSRSSTVCTRVPRTCALVGARRASKRRSTVSGRMTLRYSFRL
jgi:bifunctional ADP-heptose synthase (sugar kinase/adenylyltransferase)